MYTQPIEEGTQVYYIEPDTNKKVCGIVVSNEQATKFANDIGYSILENSSYFIREKGVVCLFLYDHEKIHTELDWWPLHRYHIRTVK